MQANDAILMMKKKGSRSLTMSEAYSSCGLRRCSVFWLIRDCADATKQGVGPSISRFSLRRYFGARRRFVIWLQYIAYLSAAAESTSSLWGPVASIQTYCNCTCAQVPLLIPSHLSCFRG